MPAKLNYYVDYIRLNTVDRIPHEVRNGRLHCARGSKFGTFKSPVALHHTALHDPVLSHLSIATVLAIYKGRRKARFGEDVGVVSANSHYMHNIRGFHAQKIGRTTSLLLPAVHCHWCWKERGNDEAIELFCTQYHKRANKCCRHSCFHTAFRVAPAASYNWPRCFGLEIKF